MQKWEFRTEVREILGFAEDWNHRGGEGWELVSVIRPEADKAAFYWYFKRPVEEEASRTVPLAVA